MVYVLLADGFEESEALVPTDLLRRAGVEVALVGVTGTTVTGGHGIAVQCDLPLKKAGLENLEMVILPGGMGGVHGISASTGALALVERAVEQGIWVAAICAAPTILARMGVLDRRSAVCYPGMEELMGSAVVKKGERVVMDGHIITGEAAGSAFEFGLKLVEVLRGPDAAQQVRHAVHYHG